MATYLTLGFIAVLTTVANCDFFNPPVEKGDFSDRGLIRVPARRRLFYPSVDLSVNLITDIPPLAFPAPVRYLNLSLNRIRHVSALAFRLTAALESLHLDYNLLSCVPLLQTTAYSLMNLTLAVNEIARNCLSPEKQTFVRLRYVDLSWNLLTRLPEVVLNAPLLAMAPGRFHMTGNCISCAYLLEEDPKDPLSTRFPINLRAYIDSVPCAESHDKYHSGCIPYWIAASIEVLNDTAANLTWQRDEWDVAMGEAETAAEENATVKVSEIPGTESPKDRDKTASEVAFMTCIMIFVCTTCLGSVLYLGQKSRMSNSYSEKFESEYSISGFDSNYDSRYSNGSRGSDGSYSRGSSGSYGSGSYPGSYAGSYRSQGGSRRSSYGEYDRNLRLAVM